MTGVLLF